MSRDDAGRALAVETPPIWQLEAGVPPTARPEATGTLEFDVAVVGAGLAGLSTAYHLACLRPAWNIGVFEAGAIAAGASGRNTGICGPGVGSTVTWLCRRFGDETAARMFQYSLDAVEHVDRLVQDERIDCGLAAGRQVLGARTHRQARALSRQAECFARLGFEIPYVRGAGAEEVAGTGGFISALAYPHVRLLDPLRLTRGLADAAERRGVTVYEGSPVNSLDQERTGVTGSVGAAASVRARTVVLATDGYTPDTLGHRSRLVRLRTHVIATDALPDSFRSARRELLDAAVLDQRTIFSYFRVSPQGRLLIGGGPVSQPSGVEAADLRGSRVAWARLHRELVTMFPDLADVPIVASWSGTTGVTPDRLPVVGPVPRQPDVYFAGAWCGHGVALSVANGQWVAADISGEGAPPRLPWHRTRTGMPPVGPLQAPAIRTYLKAADLGDRIGTHLHALRGGPGSLAPPPDTRTKELR